MAYQLASTITLEEALAYVLKTCLNFPGADSGWVYLAESATGTLILASQEGPKHQYAAAIQAYILDSQRLECLRHGVPLYCEPGIVGDQLRKDGILSLAALPLKTKHAFLGVLCIGFDCLQEFQNPMCFFYESIACKAAEVVFRIQLREKLAVQKVLLEEGNTALKVLLRQREEELGRLEQTVVENVRRIVTPYIEKLRKSGPTEQQRLLLDILESQLKEIVTPLLNRTKVGSFLTPSELRVAELIRHGQSTKEIVDVLDASESTVLFHRKNIRHKLGLTGKKVNLTSYLSDPAKW